MRIRSLFAIATTTFVIGVLLPAAPAAQPKGERVTVKGEVVEMWCYLEGGDRGPPAQELLLSKMSEVVTVTGTLVRHPNAQMIYIESVK